ncbi:tetratricopeptide repeat-containing sensor histidine kinase [Flavobacterium sp.]|uniref:tetratricopeptide repeat-containing sensor histidine kinase n=1 Tax=Flavobacterium sp. TaxID=239 RepID=UPI002FDE5C51
MILKRFCFPIFFILLLVCSCEHEKSDAKNAKSFSDSFDKASRFATQQNFDSAFYYYEKSKNSADSEEQRVYALIQIAELQRMFCDFAGAEASATEALKQCKDEKYLPYVYNILGIVSHEQLNYAESIKNFEKCYQYAHSKIDKAIIENNIAVVYLEKQDFKKAAQILEQTIINKELKTNISAYARVMDNLGFAYFKLNNTKAASLLIKASELRESCQIEVDKIASYMHLAEYYQKSNPSLSLLYSKKAYDAAQKVNSPDDQLEAMKFMIINSPLSESKNLALRQIRLSDSITKVRQSAKNQFAKIKYDATKATEAKEKAETQKRNLTILLFVLLTISFVIISYIRNRNSKKLKTSVYDTEVRIAKRIHDELANDVFQTMTFAETQNLSNQNAKEQLLDNLENIYTRTRNISQSNSDIDCGANFENNLRDLLDSFNNESTNIIITNRQGIDWNTLGKEKKIAVFRVLQELMVNMKKHSEANVVVVGFSETKKTIEIKYSDNGKGVAISSLTKKGLQNVENRIHVVKGTFTFDTEQMKGFKAHIIIPK